MPMSCRDGCRNDALVRPQRKHLMKLRNPDQRRPRPGPAASAPAKGQQEVDFTAEGSPPPGKVGAERPALPADSPDTPAAARGAAPLASP